MSSVSLCCIVIELEDSEEILKSFEYTASNHSLVMSSPVKKTGKSAEDWLKMSKQLKGRRDVQQITVETYTMDEDTSISSGACSTKEGSPAVDTLDPRRPSAKDQICFVSGNPCVEVTKGIIHLYKENERTSLEGDSPRSQMICMLAVPSSMSCQDLLQFLAPCQPDIEHVRIIKDNSPNQYMVLVKFRTQSSTDQFYETFHGMPYNTLETELICHLVYVATLQTMKSSGEDFVLPPSGHTELPTCPVCLERMDESVDGILTILCNHSFHGSCLAKWGDTSCPVCRYVQTPEVVADNRCFECQTGESLWICLICGNIGCGRYSEGHAYGHFLGTNHCYAMQLGNNRVWDYVGDNFVHRLMQNNVDGKLVEVSDGNHQVPYSKDQRHETEEKLDSVQLEFTYLLTSQLESQRLYFEEKITLIEKESMKEREESKEKARKSLEENASLQERLAPLTKEKQVQDRKLSQLTNKLTKIQSELQDERHINKSMQKDHAVWQEKVVSLEKQLKDMKENRDKEIHELKEQLRDVMFFLDAQETIKNSASRDEIAEGQVIIGESAAEASKHSATHTRRKKR